MITDQQQEYINDGIDADVNSVCCGTPMDNSNTICMACKEHSSPFVCKHEETIDVGDEDRGSDLYCTTCGKENSKIITKKI